MTEEFNEYCQVKIEEYSTKVKTFSGSDTKRYEHILNEYRNLVTELNSAAISMFKLNEQGLIEKNRLEEVMDGSLERFRKEYLGLE